MDPHRIETMAQLEALYPEKPFGPSLLKVADRIIPEYKTLIEAAPFVVLATNGPDDLDCSPRGDAPGFIRVTDEHTLMIPDRRGNNRIDSLRNIVRDPRVALLFLIPGVGETIRVMGTAAISTDPALTESFVVNGKTPRSVLVVTAETVFYQCTKAIVRSRLWDPATRVELKSLPTAGAILATLTKGEFGGPEHDRNAPQRVKETLY